MKKTLFIMAGIFMSQPAVSSALTVEELRISKAQRAMPKVFDSFSTSAKSFEQEWKTLKGYEQAKYLVSKHANDLWLSAIKRAKTSQLPDDRTLYWARLSFNKVIRTVPTQFALSGAEKSVLVSLFESGSRGRSDLEYLAKTPKKILLTGFDPFLLDKNINQSNPSGLAALMLDGEVIEYKGVTAEINTVMIPVRYEDFDNGLIEEILAPYYALENVDMIVTVSMGRKDFDLERFPGKRRSVTAPDNANVLSGGTETSPIISKLNGKPLPGKEFVEFSLPVHHMQKADKPYDVIDNKKVTTLNGDQQIQLLSQLTGEVAVKGGGGGYLSNEISYRSIRIRNELNSSIPTGHIHTPRIQQFEPEIELQIVKQIKEMLKYSLTAL